MAKFYSLAFVSLLLLALGSYPVVAINSSTMCL